MTWLLVTMRKMYLPTGRRSIWSSCTSLRFAAISPDQTRRPSMEYSSTVEIEVLDRESFKRSSETKGLGNASTETSVAGSTERLILRDDGCTKPWRMTRVPTLCVPNTAED